MRIIKFGLTALLSLTLAGCADFLESLTASSNGVGGGGGSNKVAVLLPLSGPAGSAGSEIRLAMAMALADTNASLDVQYFDTASTASGAQAAGQAASQFGAGIVLGPLIGSNIAPARAGLGNGPAIIALSNDATKASPNNYVFNVTPANSTSEILDYAARTGKRRIGILYPQNTFGLAALAAARAEASSAGITIVAAEGYSVEAGREGATSRQAAAQTMGAKRGEIDGLFIPDGGPRLREISSLAFFYRLDPSDEAYLGTALMDDPSLISEPALNGATYSAVEGSLAAFQARFAAQHGSAPRISSVAGYDAMALAASLVNSGRGFRSSSITSSNGFTGALGAYRLLGNGMTDRQLAIKQITSNGLTVVSSAGSSFLF